jgi:UDP-N-acetylmuramoyl-tripeptide--D-alanyl-D-alanine ligase
MKKRFSFQEIAEFGKLVNCPVPEKHGFESVSTDSRQDCSGSIFIPLSGETFDGHRFIPDAITRGATGIVVDSAHAELTGTGELRNLPVLVVDDTLAFYQSLANRYRNRFPDLKLVGITGSSGKTSCKEILRALLQHSFGHDAVLATEANTNNQVGVPQNLLRLRPEHRAAVIEMGTNHPGEIEPLSKTAEPNAAILTTVGASHLEFFGTRDAVAREKACIFKGLKPGAAAILPADSEFLGQLRAATKKFRQITFGTDESADWQVVYRGGRLDGSRFILRSRAIGFEAEIVWSLCGRHQATNAAAAAAAAFALGADPAAFPEALWSCVLPGMRMKVEKMGDIALVNDAYNANPDSMRAALEWLSEFAPPPETLLVLGDMLELGDVSPVLHAEILDIARNRFSGSSIFTVGPRMAEAVAALSPGSANLRAFASSEEAGDFLKNNVGNKTKYILFKGSRGMRLETAIRKYRG